ncbi:hypothetical protein BG005_000632 [Podila minutissima]|nr:hypothetical protein BG005_000632 [Podila minutissima]
MPIMGHPGQPQHPQQRFNVPPSPGQRPLGATIPGVKPGPPPQNQVRPPPQQPEPQAVTLAEPDAPLSDSNDEGFDDDDIEGGAPKIPSGPPQTVQSTPPPSESSGEKSGPPPQRAGGPPLGPPRGPPKNENATSRKLSSASGTGPVQILAPSNNPSSPPASAFPPMGQPRPRVRPPPGNKQHTPYRPPERPSQAPVMYSQSGQPAFSQPFPQEANGSDDSTAQTPLLSQGLESASSSVRPREGGLHKRVVANDNNIKKADSPVNAPPSPKIHGLKGPAILSVSGQKTPSSATKTLKTWAIRGGLAYLGYTAVFNCAPDSTGVRGLYCKATNGVGGLIKPFVAPQYNAHVGPHVDRYIKPVARQGHKIYIKVADPVVQGALSAAGAVYKSTAKKHVDSAKDQVISILPYPFKSKADSSNEAEEPKEHPKPFEKVSRQPIHADEPHGSVDQDQHQGEEKSHLSETLEQIAEEVKETLEQVEEKVAEAKEAVLEHLKPVVETVHHVVEEAIEHVHHEEESKEVKHDHVVEQDSNGLGEEAHVVVDEVKKGDPILDSVNTFPDSMKKLDDDVADAQAAEEPQIETVTEAKEEMEERGHWYAAPDPEPVPTPELEVDPVPTANEPVAAEQEIEAPEPTPEATPVPVTEEIVAETTPAFADIPTPASKVPEAEPVPVEEHVETHVEPAAEAVQDTNTDTPTGDTHSEPHIQEEEESKASHEEQDTHPSESDDEVAEEEQDSVVPKELEHEGEQADHRHEQQAARVPEAGDSTSGHDEL